VPVSSHRFPAALALALEAIIKSCLQHQFRHGISRRRVQNVPSAALLMLDKKLQVHSVAGFGQCECKAPAFARVLVYQRLHAKRTNRRQRLFFTLGNANAAELRLSNYFSTVEIDSCSSSV
jgi:hypothetical protein